MRTVFPNGSLENAKLLYLIQIQPLYDNVHELESMIILYQQNKTASTLIAAISQMAFFVLGSLATREHAGATTVYYTYAKYSIPTIPFVLTYCQILRTL